MKTYVIKRTKAGVKLFAEDENGSTEITPKRSLALARHSPDGFEYGYAGSGPAQLALAILLDAFDSAAPSAELVATDHYQDFKAAFLVSEDRPVFEIEQADIFRWLGKKIGAAHPGPIA